MILMIRLKRVNSKHNRMLHYRKQLPVLTAGKEFSKVQYKNIYQVSCIKYCNAHALCTYDIDITISYWHRLVVTRHYFYKARNWNT